MRALPEVDLSPPRSESDARLLQRIYPLYLHELSALTDYYRVDDEGRWQPDHLPDWLRGGQQHALIIRVGARPAGFSFVAEVPFPYMHPDCDFQLSEFFVLNQWRRRGVGTAAALGTFGRFGGRWVVTEVTRNEVAQAFWRTVIGSYTGGRFEETRSEEEVVQRFTNP